MSAKFHIEKIAGKFTIDSRVLLKEQFDQLLDGHHTVMIEPGKVGYKASRYKYYFDCLMWQLLNEAATHYRFVNPDTGEERKPVNTTEMHVIMRAIYNPVILVAGNKTRVIAGSTTDLNDREFIGDYSERIISDHSGPPFNIEFVSYEDWKGLHAANGWHNFKSHYAK